ncbi:MAG: PHP domain-containing protein [Clostridia bacterium]|nr:PHP domain-containing protein [Clostridia bacterium]
MRIRGDYHMHSRYSGDSNNDLEAIVQRAIEIGLEEIAITDHGPSHNGYGIKRIEYGVLRREIDHLNEKYPQIKVLLGLEANILGVDGRIDLDEEMRGMNDWVNAGYHFGSNLKMDYKIHLDNIFSKFSKKIHNRALKTNTEAMISAMRNNKINMITHPGAKGPIDIAAVAKAAAETGTMLEINNSHGHLTTDEIVIAMQFPVKFVLNSDAHKIEDIGKVEDSISRVIEAGLDPKRVYNIIEE